ncbi:Gfo/Idh/MocA family protein [Kineococcus rubinsiae]|uniref:Gfo/Idh/MocA family protein n=1 Tax=Kineococcus rubinsiae TaxID=2609562 RepID=UPI001431F3C7|nr:Gfo/Idh/MocA family oxidoreductase [Kineococcus rubinsiae]NIZ90717.1 dehydrogenase [Kineococcus rubinsiae]
MSDLHLGLVGVGRIGVMHARTIVSTPGVDRLTIADVDPDRARQVADDLGASAARDVDALLAAGIDGLVVATGTASHPELIRAGVDAGIPVFSEKPVAPDVVLSMPVLKHIAERSGTVRIGHQRRCDPGYREARRAYLAGELGWLHAVRAVTCDVSPPPVAFLATSGGLFRDVSVHDFDVIRWITGRDVVEVYARGSNNGDPAIAGVGDVDSALAVCTLDDGTLAVVTASRYNGAGHDVRLELQGSLGTLQVGLDDSSALRSAEPGVAFPGGTPHTTFAERFAEAYRAEIAAFVDLVQGVAGDDLCTPADAVAASAVADAAQESLRTGAPVRVS